jgi:hypothetical protein
VSPALLAAIARAVAEHGARPVIAERTHAIYEILNDHEAARYARVVSFDDLPLRITNIPGATSLRVPIAVPELIEDCDYFIGVPQLRTHASVVYSNAMKNLVGPGYTTNRPHGRVDESTVDLNLARPQDPVICDGTTVTRATRAGALSGLPAASRNAVARRRGRRAGRLHPDSVAFARAHHAVWAARARRHHLLAPLGDLAFDMVKAPVESFRVRVSRPRRARLPGVQPVHGRAMRTASELCAWDAG